MPLAQSLAAFVFTAALLSAACREPGADVPLPVPHASGSDSAVVDSAPAPAHARGSAAGFLDPNLATAASLTELPGMSDSVALAVIAGRPYTSMLGLDRVLARHMPAERRDSVYARVWIPLNLNTASSEEILLVPGVDSDTRQELEDHRPYESIEDFHRRIGARLGPEEASRLQTYIALP